MLDCEIKCACPILAIFGGIVTGIILGVVFGFGMISTWILFWAYLLFGVLAILLTPIYRAFIEMRDCNRYYFRYTRRILFYAVGTVITAIIGLIAFSVTFIGIIVAVTVAVATFFAATTLGMIVCFAY